MIVLPKITKFGIYKEQKKKKKNVICVEYLMEFRKTFFSPIFKVYLFNDCNGTHIRSSNIVWLSVRVISKREGTRKVFGPCDKGHDFPVGGLIGTDDSFYKRVSDSVKTRITDLSVTSGDVLPYIKNGGFTLFYPYVSSDISSYTHCSGDKFTTTKQFVLRNIIVITDTPSVTYT